MPLRTDKIIFYHIPKTGGMWVRVSLKKSEIPFELYHEKLDTEYTRIGLSKDHIVPRDTPDWFKENRFSFCNVRHPVTWYKSYWCHRIRRILLYKRKRIPSRRFRLDKKDIWDNSFEKFMENVFDQYPGGFVTYLYQCFLEDSPFDFIGRQENLLEDTLKVYKMAGQEVNEEAIRAAGKPNMAYSHAKYKEMCKCPKSLEDKILDVEKWVVERFYSQ